jgi:hypothetical protein
VKVNLSSSFSRALFSPIGGIAAAFYAAFVYWKVGEPTVLALASRIPELRWVYPAFVGIQGYIVMVGAALVLEPAMSQPMIPKTPYFRFLAVALPSLAGAIASTPLVVHLLTAPAGIIAFTVDLMVALGSHRRQCVPWFRSLVLVIGGVNLVICLIFVIWRLVV